MSKMNNIRTSDMSKMNNIRTYEQFVKHGLNLRGQTYSNTLGVKRNTNYILRYIRYCRFMGLTPELWVYKYLLTHVWKTRPVWFKQRIGGRRCLWCVGDAGSRFVPLAHLSVEELLVYTL